MVVFEGADARGHWNLHEEFGGGRRLLRRMLLLGDGGARQPHPPRLPQELCGRRHPRIQPQLHVLPRALRLHGSLQSAAGGGLHVDQRLLPGHGLARDHGHLRQLVHQHQKGTANGLMGHERQHRQHSLDQPLQHPREPRLFLGLQLHGHRSLWSCSSPLHPHILRVKTSLKLKTIGKNSTLKFR